MPDHLCPLCTQPISGYGKLHYLCPECYALFVAQQAKAELERAEEEQRRREEESSDL